MHTNNSKAIPKFPTKFQSTFINRRIKSKKKASFVSNRGFHLQTISYTISNISHNKGTLRCKSSTALAPISKNSCNIVKANNTIFAGIKI